MAKSAGIKVLGGSCLIAGSLTLTGGVDNLADVNDVSGIELLSVTIQAYKDVNNQSTANIAIVANDPSTGANAQGYVLAPGESITINIRDASAIQVVGAAGNGLIWFGLVQ